MLRFIEGFEASQHATYLSRLYATATGTIGFNEGRKHGKAIASANARLRTKALVASVENDWIVNFALCKTTSTDIADGSATAGVALRNSSGEQCKLKVIKGDSTGTFKLRLVRGGNTIATSSQSFAFGGLKAWHYFALKLTVRTGLNGVYELRHYDLNGSETVVLSGTSVNLADQGSDGADRVEFDCNGGGSPQLSFDDIVVFDGTGGVNDDFPGQPLVVVGSLPTSDGSTVGWITSSGAVHYSLVDDPATLPNDTDYVQASNSGDKDLYGYGDFAVIKDGAAAVVGIQVNVTAAMQASGSQTLRARVRDGGSEAAGAGFTVDDTVLASYPTTFDVSPVTAAPWTKATLEASEVGVDIQ